MKQFKNTSHVDVYTYSLGRQSMTSEFLCHAMLKQVLRELSFLLGQGFLLVSDQNDLLWPKLVIYACPKGGQEKITNRCPTLSKKR